MTTNTTEGKAVWPWAKANRAGMRLLGLFAPYCHKLQLAGSIRRKRPEVGDVEIVCIPRHEGMLLAENQPRLFGETPPTDVDLLEIYILQMIKEGAFAYVYNSLGSKTFGPRNKRLVDLASGIQVDIFCAGPVNWGMTLFVRTGPREFVVKAMRHFHTLDLEGHAYACVTRADGSEIQCREEKDVFDILQWEWIEPPQRYGGADEAAAHAR